MKCNVGFHKQQGVATLFTAVVILLVMSLMAAYAYRSALLENQLMSNLYRAKQAEETAEAALDFGLAYFMANGIDATGDNAVDVLDPSTVTNGRRAAVQFCTATSNIPTCSTPTDFSRVMIMATGWSDDQTAIHRSRVLVATNPFFGASPKAPLIIKGGTNFIGGNMSVTNNTGTGVNIWSGDDIQGASGSFQTYGKVNGIDDQAISEKTNNKYYLGPDIVYNDQTLKNATTDDFYESMIGRSLSEMSNSYDVKLASCNEMTSGNNYAGKIVYVTGDCALNRDLGTSSSNTILVVAGTLTLSGNNSIYGSIVSDVLGNVTGSSTVYGSLIARSAPNNFAGTVNLIMSTASNTNLQKLTVKSVVGNSWRDW